VQGVKINNYSCVKRSKKKDSSSYRGHKLFLSEDKFEVIWVNYGIASISFFKIDVLLSSESIQFGIKITRVELDNKIELQEIFRLLYLFLDQYLGSIKILKVFMICNNINEKGWTF